MVMMRMQGLRSGKVGMLRVRVVKEVGGVVYGAGIQGGQELGGAVRIERGCLGRVVKHGSWGVVVHQLASAPNGHKITDIGVRSSQLDLHPGMMVKGGSPRGQLGRSGPARRCATGWIWMKMMLLLLLLRLLRMNL